MKLGVNIDHVATIREARGTSYPSIIEAATRAEKAGADSITLHLREDRRHMQDIDLYELKPLLKTKMNLELAPTEEMIALTSNFDLGGRSYIQNPLGRFKFVLNGLKNRIF